MKSSGQSKLSKTDPEEVQNTGHVISKWFQDPNLLRIDMFDIPTGDQQHHHQDHQDQAACAQCSSQKVSSGDSTELSVEDLGIFLSKVPLKDFETQNSLTLLICESAGEWRNLLQDLLDNCQLFDHIHLWFNFQVSNFLDSIQSNDKKIIGELVSLKLIENLMNLMYILPLTVNDLKKNTTGRLVRSLRGLKTEDSNETILEMSSKLMDKWKELIKENNLKIKSKTKSTASTGEDKLVEKVKTRELFPDEMPSKLQKDNDEIFAPNMSSADGQDNYHKKVTFASGDSVVITRSFVPLEFEDVPPTSEKDFSYLRRKEETMDDMTDMKTQCVKMEWTKPIKFMKHKFNLLRTVSEEKLIQENRIKTTLRDINLNQYKYSPAEPEGIAEHIVGDLSILGFERDNEDTSLELDNKTSPTVEIPLAANEAERILLFNPISQCSESQENLEIHSSFNVATYDFCQKKIDNTYDSKKFYTDHLAIPPQQPLVPQPNIPYNLQPVPGLNPQLSGLNAVQPIAFGQMHNLSAVNKTNALPCNHFFTKGWCKFKNNCMFSHSMPKSNPIYPHNGFINTFNSRQATAAGNTAS